MSTDWIKEEAQINAVTERIIRAAFMESNVLGCGFLERASENEVTIESSRQERHVRQQHPIRVLYAGVRASDFLARLPICLLMKFAKLQQETKYLRL